MTENTENTGDKIRRFSSFRIVEHWLIMSAFAVLVVTGLSQRFYTFDLSVWLIFKLGGIDNVRLIHRYTGVLFSVITLTHVMVGIIGIMVKGWTPSMTIVKKDFTDAIYNIKYYIGMENHPARCGRYDYKQKFVYWLVLLSGFFMIATGLALWFPTVFTRFLPGEIIPAAKILHTNHGFLAFLVIAIWHIYDSVFSPDVFPLDASIFTGYISRERMLREHPLELEIIDVMLSEDIIVLPQREGETPRV